MASKSYKVVSAVATPYLEDGARVYLYEGAEWPEGGLRKGETERFLDLKYIAEIKSATSDTEPSGYKSLKADELKAEIDKRNEGREEADQISPEGKKEDLVAALEADDSK